MKKMFTYLGIAVASFFVLTLIIIFFFLGFVVKTGIETVGPTITKTPITVGSVRLSPLTGSGVIKNLVVGNPENFNTDFLFRLGEVSFDVELSSLFSDTIVVKDITIRKPEIFYEQGLTSGSNLSILLNNLSSDAAPAEKEKAPGEEDGEGKKLQIDHFLLADGMVHLSAVFLQEGSLSVKLPSVELHDIGKESDDPSINAAVQEIMIAVATSVQGVLVESNPMFKDGANTLKSSTGALQDSLKSAGKSIQEGGTKIFESFKDFFNSDK